MIWGYHGPFDGEYRPNVRISSTAYLHHPERIEFADDIFVWHYTILDGTGGLRIGTGTQVGAWVGVFTHSSHLAIRLLGSRYRSVRESEKPAYPIAPVEIGEYVFVAAGSKVLPGVSIGSYSLVAALSVVNRDVPAHSIVAGNPAKVIGSTKELDRKAIAELDQVQLSLLDPTYLQLLLD
jgi:acetyltransferase-like isoleucine patch superfamily enzyme